MSEQALIEEVKQVFHSKCPPLNPPLFIFKQCPLAAAHNAHILANNNFDLDRAIQSQHPSQISYGSEFRSSSSLKKLLSNHPLWDRLRKILDEGAEFPLDPIAKGTRKADITYHKERGNHKSLAKYSSFIDPVISEDIERGFALPLPVEILDKLPNASLAPLGCHKQTSINELGEVIPKYRLIHDQSFPGPSGLSVNGQMRKNELPPIMYSYVLSQLLHYIVNTRKIHPTTKIFICKIDLDAAYRRCSLSGKTCLESLTIYAGLLLVALRLTFGGSPGPNIWGVISETMTDLANTILQNEYWDQTSLYDPISDSITQKFAPTR
jgi:hypothetical protein